MTGDRVPDDEPGPEPTAPVRDLGGPLLVTPAGAVLVATDAMLALVDRLRVLESALHADRRRVAAAEEAGAGIALPEVARALDGLQARCADFRESLVRAATGYATAERDAIAVQLGAGAAVAPYVAPVALSLVLLLASTAPGLLMTVALLGGPERLGLEDRVRRLLLDHPGAITDPRFVRSVAIAVSSVDDAGPSVLGIPLGERGGAEVGAAGLISLAGPLGLLRETPVAVDRVATVTGGGAPIGVRERLDRIPEGDQVRIERYEADGMPPRFTVYIGPTETFSPVADHEPWDLTSNIAGVAGLSPGSLRAVELAMADAGIAPDDEVQVVGFSQGGLIATMVAASGDWNVVGIETHGAPAGNIPLPTGLNGLAIRNTDDFIPALAGPQLDDHLVQVQREAFAGSTPPRTDLVVPAHQRSAYEATADAVDVAQSATVRDQVRAVDDFARDYLAAPGGAMTVSTYHAIRVGGPAPD